MGSRDSNAEAMIQSSLSSSIPAHFFLMSKITEGLAPDVNASWPVRKADPDKTGNSPFSRESKGPTKESTFTENMSSRGLRAITKKIWLPGARLLVSFAGDKVAEETSVVYCQRLGIKKFAVGLALSAKVHQHLP